MCSFGSSSGDRARSRQGVQPDLAFSGGFSRALPIEDVGVGKPRRVNRERISSPVIEVTAGVVVAVYAGVRA